MAKNVATLALGAGAATAYLRPDLVAGAAFDAAFGPLQRLQLQPSSNSDTEALKQMVSSPTLREAWRCSMGRRWDGARAMVRCPGGRSGTPTTCAEARRTLAGGAAVQGSEDAAAKGHGGSSRLRKVSERGVEIAWVPAPNPARPTVARVASPRAERCRGVGVVTYTVAAVGVGAVLYLTIFRGWRFADFMYVTRRGLKQGLDQLHTRTFGVGGPAVWELWKRSGESGHSKPVQAFRRAGLLFDDGFGPHVPGFRAGGIECAAE